MLEATSSSRVLTSLKLMHLQSSDIGQDNANLGDPDEFEIKERQCSSSFSSC